jgi:pimeloyl-ACP methyl ester carboxylesterase
MSTQFLTLPDGKIAFDDQGHGPMILCAPAGGDLRSEYRFLAPRLVAAGYRVVTMDLRGQGESSASWPTYSATAMGSDMLALLQHLDGGPATIIATSKPVQAAVWAAVESPEWVRGIVLIGAHAHALPAWRARLMAGTLLAEPWGNALYADYFPKLYPNIRPPDFADHHAKVNGMLREPGRLAALRNMFSDNGIEADRRISRVRVPVLILMGERDPDLKHPEIEAHKLAARFQATRTRVGILAAAGHHPQTEMPEEVAKIILEFLTSYEQTLQTAEKY